MHGLARRIKIVGNKRTYAKMEGDIDPVPSTIFSEQCSSFTSVSILLSPRRAIVTYFVTLWSIFFFQVCLVLR